MTTEAIVTTGNNGVQFPEGTAQLNITFSGSNGDLLDPIPLDYDDDAIKSLAVEAIRDGYVAGIPSNDGADFSDFVVERFNATEDVPFNRIMLRPKVPFGA